jgi:hypothetical protein
MPSTEIFAACPLEWIGSTDWREECAPRFYKQGSPGVSERIDAIAARAGGDPHRILARAMLVSSSRSEASSRARVASGREWHVPRALYRFGAEEG